MAPLTILMSMTTTKLPSTTVPATTHLPAGAREELVCVMLYSLSHLPRMPALLQHLLTPVRSAGARERLAPHGRSAAHGASPAQRAGELGYPYLEHPGHAPPYCVATVAMTDIPGRRTIS